MNDDLMKVERIRQEHEDDWMNHPNVTMVAIRMDNDGIYYCEPNRTDGHPQ